MTTPEPLNEETIGPRLDWIIDKVPKDEVLPRVLVTLESILEELVYLRLQRTNSQNDRE